MTSPRSRITCGLALLALLAVGAVRPAAAADTVSVDKRLPSNVYVYFTIPDVEAAKKRFKASSMGKMLDDKAFAEFRKDIEVLIKKGSAEIEKQTGLKLDDILAIPSGELAFAVIKSERKVPTFVVSLNFGKHEASVDKLLKLAEKASKNGGATRKTVMYKGTEIVVYNKPGGGDPQIDMAYVIKDSTFVLASEAAALKTVLDRWDGKHESTFANNKVYSYIKRRTRPGSRTALMTWYLDPLGLANAAVGAIPEGAGAQAKIGMAMLSGLGLGKLKAMGGSSDWAVGEYESLSKTVIYVDQPASGVMDLFRFPAAGMKPPKWIGADVESYAAFNWDLKKAYASVANLFGTFTLAGPDALDAAIDDLATKGPKVHLKKDVLNQLTGRVDIATQGGGAGGGLGMAKVTAAFGVKDAAKLQAVLTKVTGMAEFPGKKRTVGGKTIYEVDLGALGAGEAVVGFGVINKQLYITSDITVLENIAKGKMPKKSLVDSKAYKAIAAKMPAKTSMISFSNGSASQLKDAWEMVRGGLVPVGPDFPIDLTKLPPYSALKKYLMSSGSYAIPDKNGVYMESIQLKPSK